MPGPVLVTGATTPLGSTVTAGLLTPGSQVRARPREPTVQNQVICAHPPAITA